MVLPDDLPRSYVMVVEDDFERSSQTVAFFESLGRSAYGVASVAVAMDFLDGAVRENRLPAWVLLDLDRLGLSGRNFRLWLLDTPRLAVIPVLAWAGAPMEPQEVLSLSLSGFVLKPRPRLPDFPHVLRQIDRISLTPREYDVLACLLEGGANKQIARMLGVSESMVKTHLRHIMQKYSVSSRTELILRYSKQPDLMVR